MIVIPFPQETTPTPERPNTRGNERRQTANTALKKTQSEVTSPTMDTPTE
jgi:hypothetical protein